MKRYMRGMGFYLLMFAVIIAIFTLTTAPKQQDKDIYSDLILKIQQGEVPRFQLQAEKGIVHHGIHVSDGQG